MADPNKVAERIAKKAADALTPLALEMKLADWPAEFRAIVWGAVSHHAAILQAESDAEHRRALKTR